MMRLRSCPAEIFALSTAATRPLRLAVAALIVSAACAHGQSPIPAAAHGQSPVSDRDSNRIAGRVVSTKDGAPLDRVRVSLENKDNPQQAPQSVVTGADGRFAFDQLAPGKYPLYGAKRGYSTSFYDAHEQFFTAIVTGAGVDTENLTLRLTPTANMVITVLDEAGEPVRGAQVGIFRDTNRLGQGRTVRVNTVGTDDLGVAESRSVAPGNYFVMVTTSPWYATSPQPIIDAGAAQPAAQQATIDRSLDVAYTPTYYPNATSMEEATPIPVKGGDQVEIEIHLTPSAALHLLFHLQSRNGKTDEEMGRAGYPSLQNEAFNGPGGMVPMTIQSLGGDLLEMTGLLPGKYKVKTSGAPGLPTRTKEIMLTADGQELDSSDGELDGSMKATVLITDGTKPPSQMEVVLADASLTAVAGGQLNDKGEATLENVEPGEYKVLVQGPGSRYSITSVVDDASAEGVESAGRMVTIVAGSQRTVSLLVTSGTGRVKGFVKHDGAAAAGAMVVLVPKNPELNVELFARDQSDLDGSFDIGAVTPGEYRILAIENGWDLEWSKPDVIAHYLPQAQPVTVTDTRGRAISLPTAVNLQQR